LEVPIPPERIQEIAIGQVNSHGVDSEITPPEVGLHGKRVVKGDSKIPVPYSC
jgi:hypothetical protein